MIVDDVKVGTCGVFTDVFHFRDDRWQIVASHGTTVAA